MHTSPIDLEVVRRDLDAAPRDPATHTAGRYRWESWLYGRSGHETRDDPAHDATPRRTHPRRAPGRHRRRRYTLVDITELSG
ncbi:MAG TPA: hypothetical protein VGN37_12780 [Actinocatenispora sp.]